MSRVLVLVAVLLASSVLSAGKSAGIRTSLG